MRVKIIHTKKRRKLKKESNKKYETWILLWDYYDVITKLQEFD
jgi:hypothetical protein